jgi:peroxiredoxin/mono/diheme cytochrome c family protein
MRAFRVLWCLFAAWSLISASAPSRLSASEPGAAASVAPRLTELRLPDFRGRVVELDEFADKQVLCVAFLGVECPLAIRYTDRLVELQKQFADQSVAFVAIDANPQDSLAELAAHARRHNVEFPLLKDGDQRVAQALGATRTPEVFVLDRRREVRYHGRIDDQYGIGYVRLSATTHDLKDALNAVLAGQPVLIAHQPAVGCRIGKLAEPKADATVTYSSHVAAIFSEACVRCHRPGEIGPFQMTSYAEVAPWAETIAEVVSENRMPPWHANPEHGKFANDMSLSQEQRDLILQWVADGAPEGDPSQLPEPRQYVTGWQLSREPDLVVEVSPQPFAVPADGEVKYQYFRADPGFTQDMWVSAAQILPGNRSVVHHILAFVRPKGSKEPLTSERGYLFGYVPGAYAEAYPAGVAKKIPANSELVFQVHYTPIGTPQTDHSRIGFIFTDVSKVEREVVTTSVVQPRLRIPPRDGNYATSATLPEQLPECELLTLAPHMHLRGKSFRYTALHADGSKSVLLDIPRYDFNWQTGYRLAEPLPLAAGTKIFCEASFDNSAGNLNNPNPDAWVNWGDQTTDEMMIGYFDIVVPRNKDNDALRPTRAALVEQIFRQGLFERLDANKDKRIERSEVPARWQSRFDLLDRNGDGVITEDELSGDGSR